MPKMLEANADDLLNVLVNEDIEHVLTIATVANERLASQYSKVLRHGRLGYSDHGGKIGDAHLMSHEETHDLRPGAVGQRAKRLRQGDINIVCLQSAFCRPDLLRVPNGWTRAEEFPLCSGHITLP